MKKQLLSLSLLLSSLVFAGSEQKPFEYYVELINLCKKPNQNLITRIRCLEHRTWGNPSYDIPKDLLDEVYSLEYVKNREEIEAFMNIISLDQCNQESLYNWICSDINLVNMFLDRLNEIDISNVTITLIVVRGILYSYINNLNNQQMYYLLLSRLFLKTKNYSIPVDAPYFTKALSLKDNDPILKWLFQEGLIREYIPSCSF